MVIKTWDEARQDKPWWHKTCKTNHDGRKLATNHMLSGWSKAKKGLLARYLREKNHSHLTFNDDCIFWHRNAPDHPKNNPLFIIYQRSESLKFIASSKWYFTLPLKQPLYDRRNFFGHPLGKIIRSRWNQNMISMMMDDGGLVMRIMLEKEILCHFL